MTLLLGGSGQLGTAFRSVLPGCDAPSARDLSLLDPDLGAKVVARNPDCIINCAAYTDVDRAEVEYDLARAINATAVGELAQAANQLGVPFVTFSTDHVFDGRATLPYVESSRPRPVNAYGRSKLLGEEQALAYSGTLVVRTSWLLSPTHRNFLTAILARATSGDVSVVTDQVGRPSLAASVARATADVVSRHATGLLHLSNPPATTWFALARYACRLADLDEERIAPMTSDQLDRNAVRPRQSALESERHGELGLELEPWPDVLPELVSSLLADPPRQAG